MKINTNEENVSNIKNEIYRNISNEIRLTAILSKVYAYKISNEMVNRKVKNQINSINFSINQINPKFVDKSKNYEKVSNEIIKTMSNYEDILKKICKIYDEKIDNLIYDKVEVENKILIKLIESNSNEEKKVSIKKRIVKKVGSTIEKIKIKIKKNEIVDIGLINKLQDDQDIEKEIKNSNIDDQTITIFINELNIINQRIQKLNEEKQNKIINAFENKEKGLSTEIRKPRNFKKITKFFLNRFNTYNVIMKNIILPINQRIEALQKVELINFDEEMKEIELSDFENKIIEIQNNLLNNKVIKNMIDYL